MEILEASVSVGIPDLRLRVSLPSPDCILGAYRGFLSFHLIRFFI